MKEQHGSKPARARRVPFSPVRVLELELGAPLGSVCGGVSGDGLRYASARVLVRLHGVPLGTVRVDLSSGEVGPGRVAELVWAELGSVVVEHLVADGVEPPGVLPVEGLGVSGRCGERFVVGVGAPLVSVVVPTFRRPELLVACVDSLLASDFSGFEVVVVDNDPGDGRTRVVVEERYGADGRVRYLGEWGRGVSRARNTGLAFSRGEVVLFVDDDVIVDGSWVRVMTASLLNEPSAACVTGLTLPLELLSPADVWLEDRFDGIGRFERVVFDATGDTAERAARSLALAYASGGATNLGVRKDAMDDLWSFDVSLGAEVTSNGADGLDRWLASLTEGRTAAYEPAAILWQQPAAAGDRSRLRRRSSALGAVMTKRIIGGPSNRRGLVRGYREALALLRRSCPASGDTRRDRRMARDEAAGVLAGPCSYVAERVRLAWESA